MRWLPGLCIIALIVGCSSETIVAPTLGSIRGTAKDLRTRKPLANASVQLVSRSESVVTDASGFYEMPDVAAGEFAVKAILRESNYVCYAQAPVRVDEGKTTTVDLMLVPGSSFDKGAIIGHVIDEQGKAVKGARVSTDQKTSIEVTSDNGSFVIIDVPSDTVTLDVVGTDRYARRRLFVKVGDTTAVTITALPQDPTKGWLYGSVTSKGEPVPGAIVQVQGLNLADTTDDFGTYLIRNLPEGLANVSYSRDGFRTRNFTVSTQVQIGLEKNVALSEQSTVPTEKLEFYLPFDGSIEDRSPLHRETNVNGVGYSFTRDRYNRPDQAIHFDGTTCVIAVNGIDMNYKPITIGMWFYVEEYPTTLQYMLGKISYLNGDGYCITMKNRDMSFAYVTNGGKDVSSTQFNGGFFEKNRWRWFGFSIAEDGTGYVTMNAQSTYSVKPVTGVSTNREPLTVGDVPAAANSGGFSGSLDQVVIYNRFMKLEDLAKIMESKE